MRLASCRDFMERTAGEASAEHRIDGGDAEGQGAGAALDPRRLCKACRRWRRWLIIPKPLKTQIHSNQRLARRAFVFLFCSNVLQRSGRSSRKGKGCRGAQQTPCLEAVQLPPSCLRPRAVRKIRDSLHAAAVLGNWTQSVGDGVFPDRQMRTTPAPGIGFGIAARRLRHPGKKLLRQCVCGIRHERENISWSDRMKGHGRPIFVGWRNFIPPRRYFSALRGARPTSHGENGSRHKLTL